MYTFRYGRFEAKSAATNNPDCTHRRACADTRREGLHYVARVPVFCALPRNAVIMCVAFARPLRETVSRYVDAGADSPVNTLYVAA